MDIDELMREAKILLVEDMALQLRILKVMFEEAGFVKIFTSTDGHEVETLHQTEQLDLIVIDTGLPQRDGLEVMRDFRQRFPHDPTPILVVSASDERERRLAAFQEGAWDYLVKPLDREELMLRVRNLLRVHLLLKRQGRRRPPTPERLEEWRRQARILVLDDNPIHVKVLSRYLEQSGHARVTAISDSRQVSTLYFEQNQRFDLAIVDLQMPHWDGFQVMELLRESEGREFFPILVLTAEPDRETRLSALSRGAQDLLFKPVDRDEVLARVRLLLTLAFLLQEP